MPISLIAVNQAIPVVRSRLAHAAVCYLNLGHQKHGETIGPCRDTRASNNPPPERGPARRPSCGLASTKGFVKRAGFGESTTKVFVECEGRV